MIKEWYWALTASTIDAARCLRMARDQARYRSLWHRNAKAWEEHLARSRQFILSAAEESCNHDQVVVAGSGWCLDIPLVNLSAMFKRVILLDAVHPAAIRREAVRLGNVETIGFDLSGCLNAVSSIKTLKRHRYVQPTVEALNLLNLSSLTISTNTLSFLPLTPVEYLWRSGDYDDAELNALAVAIIKAHLNWLEGQPGVRCILYDTAWLATQEGETLTTDPLRGISMPAPQACWEWQYAPRPEAHPLRDIIHVVGAAIY